eukprot:356791-Chlamydomonas_euryale.AAC.4
MALGCEDSHPVRAWPLPYRMFDRVRAHPSWVELVHGLAHDRPTGVARPVPCRLGSRLQAVQLVGVWRRQQLHTRRAILRAAPRQPRRLAQVDLPLDGLEHKADRLVRIRIPYAEAQVVIHGAVQHSTQTRPPAFVLAQQPLQLQHTTWEASKGRGVTRAKSRKRVLEEARSHCEGWYVRHIGDASPSRPPRAVSHGGNGRRLQMEHKQESGTGAALQANGTGPALHASYRAINYLEFQATLVRCKLQASI